MPVEMSGTAEINIPSLPAKHDDFIDYVTAHPDKPMVDIVEPFKQYDNELRKIFAQHPEHPAIQHPSIVPVFAGHEDKIRIRARDVQAETEKQQECFIMPLKAADRKTHGSPAIVPDLQEFKKNFSVFSESSLADLDWSNVVAAGSAVVTSLLSVPDEHAGSKRALRSYYHDVVAPASDVDLFLYGLTEEQAVEKIKQIELNIKDALLVETTTVRTKNALTIVSQHPTRHVQIVLRIYKSVSEILTGFDVDCSCAAFDGSQVWAAPRALAAYMTQINTVDLTRRSPSYENRLSKYSHRGFEIYWPGLDRSRVDPTIFERSFGRTQGLARLLVLEKLPKNEDREQYNDQRRAERGRPAIDRYRMHRHKIYGNIKEDHEDEVADWVDSEEVSDYHTFTIPYGPKYHAKKIEKLLFTKDMLLNAEWNKPKDREVHLHRHPAFFGSVEDVIHDCCGYCPTPSNDEEEEVAEEEAKIYISGDMTFIKDDPGRQAIGSFHPLTNDDWTEMAYVGNTQLLCQAIVDGDVEYVKSWLDQEGNNPDTRDYTGRTPLQLAVSNSTSEVVQALIDGGARIVARMVDGRTALHLAAIRGDVEMVSAILKKSEANREEEDKKIDARREARRSARAGSSTTDGPKPSTEEQMADRSASEDSDVDMMDDLQSSKVDATTEASMVNIKSLSIEDKQSLEEEDEDEPDVYDVDVLAWDVATSALHLAIVNGHVDVVKCLVQDFGADVLIPVKLFHSHTKTARDAILTLVLSLNLPFEQAKAMAVTLLQLGATSAQGDLKHCTAFHQISFTQPALLDTLVAEDPTGVRRAINYGTIRSSHWHSANIWTPLLSAISERDVVTAEKLLGIGARSATTVAQYIKAYTSQHGEPKGMGINLKKEFECRGFQPVVYAVQRELPRLAQLLLEEHSADPNTLTADGFRKLNKEYGWEYMKGNSLLDVVREKILELRNWQPPTFSEDDAPKPLQSDDFYLSQFEEGTFSHWSACQQLASAKRAYEAEFKQHVQRHKSFDLGQRGVEEQHAAVLDLLEQFRQLERSLLQHGAKTFKELHPDMEEIKDNPRPNWFYHREPPEDFKVKIDFRRSDLSEEATQRYVDLFEAAWSGNVERIKELTLKSWVDKDGEEHPPANITTTESEYDLSVFVIACLRSNFNLASICMNIAKMQHVPYGDDERQRRYHLETEDAYDSDDSMDNIQVSSEVVDEQFTVENIGEAVLQVKSHMTPILLLRSRFGNSLHGIFGADGKPTTAGPYSALTYTGASGGSGRTLSKRTNTGSIKLPHTQGTSSDRQKSFSRPENLFQVAILNDDEDMLTFLISLGQQYMVQKDKTDDGDEYLMSFFCLNETDFTYALELDRPRLLAIMVKSCGTGISPSNMLSRNGIELQDKRKYYQGLSVRGRKRQDWADAGRGIAYQNYDSDFTSPLLHAARFGSLESVEWLLSDAPLRCYTQFAEANKDDYRLQKITELPGGFEGLVERFLSMRSHLAIHCCLTRDWTPETEKVLQYLIKVMPQCIDVKSVDGYTPLQIAYHQLNKKAAKMLIEAGADMRTRDRMGRNLLHTLLKQVRVTNHDHTEDTIEELINLLPEKNIVAEMFQERCADDPGSLTPLAAWIQNSSEYGQGWWQTSAKFLSAILRHTDGAELGMVNGEGDTPLHVCVKKEYTKLAEVILEHSPELLLRENSTGRTPYEMARDDYMARCLANPASVKIDFQNASPQARMITQASPSHFITQKDASSDGEYVKLSMLDLLEQYRVKLEESGKAKRRLVTLHEANEVARRLAEKKASRYHWDPVHQPDAEEEQARWDEVQRWL